MLVGLAFSGCCKEPEILIKTEIVKVPIQCKIPKVECVADGNNSIAIIGNMLNCIYRLKEASKVCR